MEDKWLDDIQEKMNGFETDEPEGLWTQIQARQAQASKRRRMRRIILYISSAAAIAVILSFTCLWIFFGDKPADNDSLLATNDPITSDIANVSTAAGVHDSNDDIASAPKTVHKSSTVKRSSDNLPSQQSDSAVTSAPSVSNPQPPRETESTPIRSTPVSDIKDNRYSNIACTGDIHKSHNRKFTIGVFTSGGIGQSGRPASPYAVKASSYQWLGSDIYYGSLTPLVRSKASMANDLSNFDMKHDIPIRFGLSAKYNFTSRIGLESGIFYTRLGSTLNSRDYRQVKGEQTLHYIGVPLNFKYRLISWKSLSLFASAGIAFEKCIDGSLSKYETVPGEPDVKKTIKLSEDELQWSSSISADIQFDITRHIGIYVEPGVAYYFDNGSEIRNIYKDRPFNFNLNLGIRFSFGK